VVGLSALAGPILNLFTTPEFASGAVVIPFIALSGLLAGIYQIVINITHLVKKNQFNLFIHVLAAVSNLLLNLLLIPFVGFIGAAIATLISYTITAIITILFSFRYIRFKIYWSSISKSVAASGVMAAVILLIPVYSVYNLLIAVGSGMVLYVMIMVLIKGLDWRELGSFKDLLLNR
jgi:O-antigen/teichoic acid export membrane protein